MKMKMFSSLSNFPLHLSISESLLYDFFLSSCLSRKTTFPSSLSLEARSESKDVQAQNLVGVKDFQDSNLPLAIRNSNPIDNDSFSSARNENQIFIRQTKRNKKKNFEILFDGEKSTPE